QIKAQVDGIREYEMPAEETVAPARLSMAGDAHFPPAHPAVMPEAEVRRGQLSALDDRGDVRPLADVEADMIRFAIEHYKGQMSEVARRLGIGRSTLYRKLKEMGLEPDDGRSERLALVNG